MTVQGISWQGWEGVFFSPRYKDDVQLFVVGKRGDWLWRVRRYADRVIVAEGNAANKLAAMAAAAEAFSTLR